MDILITLTSVGANTGPTYDLYTNLDYLSAFAANVPLIDLYPVGTVYSVPNGTSSIRILSHEGICTDYTDLYIVGITTTTTTHILSTTTTTTFFGGPYEFYDVITYTCVDSACVYDGGISRIANNPAGGALTVGNFYSANGYVFEIVGLSADQASPGYITGFSGVGYADCSVLCTPV